MEQERLHEEAKAKGIEIDEITAKYRDAPATEGHYTAETESPEAKHKRGKFHKEDTLMVGITAE